MQRPCAWEETHAHRTASPGAKPCGGGGISTAPGPPGTAAAAGGGAMRVREVPIAAGSA
jgi:hypothetical protein